MTKAREIASTPETVIASGSFSAVASLSFTNALTDTYRFYNLYLYARGSTSTVTLGLRFREGTTDVTTGYYGGGNYGQYNGPTGNWFNKNNGTEFGLWTMNSSTDGIGNVRITRPSASLGVINTLVYDNVSVVGGHFSGSTNPMTNFNGFTLFPTSGTMTGQYILTGINV